MYFHFYSYPLLLSYLPLELSDTRSPNQNTVHTTVWAGSRITMATAPPLSESLVIAERSLNMFDTSSRTQSLWGECKLYDVSLFLVCFPLFLPLFHSFSHYFPFSTLYSLLICLFLSFSLSLLLSLSLHLSISLTGINLFDWQVRVCGRKEDCEGVCCGQFTPGRQILRQYWTATGTK